MRLGAVVVPNLSGVVAVTTAAVTSVEPTAASASEFAPVKLDRQCETLTETEVLVAEFSTTLHDVRCS